MKSAAVNRVIDSNMDVAQDFVPVQFVQTAEAFEIVSKNLYKYPIVANIKEPSSNAADAHCRRGEGYDRVPFVVQLPTPENPSLVIRDYGTSMTFEQISTFFFDFNRSDKREEVNSTGAMGLGAKVPYAIAEQFIITTYSGTYSQTYLAMKDSRGIPLRPASEPEKVPCDEPQGVQITIPVDLSKHQVSHFYEAAVQVLGCFGHYGSPYQTQPILRREAFTARNRYGNETHQPEVNLRFPYGAAKELADPITSFYYAKEEQKLYMAYVQPPDDDDDENKLPVVVYHAFDNSLADLNRLSEYVKGTSYLAPSGLLSKLVNGQVLVAKVMDKVRSDVFHYDQSSYSKSLSATGRADSQVYLGNVRYTFKIDDSSVYGWSKEVMESVPESVPVTALAYISPTHMAVLLHNVRSDGSPHPIVWLPSREGLVNRDNYDYLQRLTLRAAIDIYKELEEITEFLVDGCFERLSTVSKIIDYLSFFAGREVIHTLITAQLNKVWPYKLPLGSTIDFKEEQCSLSILERTQAGRARRLERPRARAEDLFMPLWLMDGLPAVLIYSAGHNLDMSMRIAERNASNIVCITCCSQSRDKIRDWLVNELEFPADLVFMSVKKATERKSSPRVISSDLGALTQCYMYDADGVSSKVTSFWKEIKPWQEHKLKEFVKANIDTNYLRKWVYKAAVKSAETSLQGEFASFRPEGMPDTLFIGVGFNTYRIAPCATAKQPDAICSDSTVAPGALVHIVRAAADLHSELFGATDLQVIGISNTSKKAWEQVHMSLTDYIYTVLGCLIEPLKMWYTVNSLVAMDNGGLCVLSPITYLATDLVQFRPRSTLRKIVSPYSESVDAATNPLNYSGLHKRIYSLYAAEQDRNHLWPSLVPTGLANVSRRSDGIWSEETYQYSVETLAATYPLLKFIDTLSLRSFLSSSATIDSGLAYPLYAYIKATDAQLR